MNINDLFSQLNVKRYKGYYKCKCPECGRQSAYFYEDDFEKTKSSKKKLVIHCNRLNHCGKTSYLDVDGTEEIKLPELKKDMLEISEKGKEILNYMAFIDGSNGDTWPGFDFDYRGIRNSLLKEARIVYLKDGLLHFMLERKSMFSNRFFETGYAYEHRDLLIPIFNEEGNQVDRYLLRDKERKSKPKELQLRLHPEGNEIWNLHELKDGKQIFCVTEGVWDGLSILQVDSSVGALSLPGVKKCMKLIEYLKQHKELWKTLSFIVCFDLDKAGEQYSIRFLHELKILGITSARLNLRGADDVNQLLEASPDALKGEIALAKERIERKLKKKTK